MYTELTDLGEFALKYAKEAVELDRKGLKSLAIERYQRAVDSLTKLIEGYPASSIRKVYLKKIREYKERIEFLRGVRVGNAKGGTGIMSNSLSETARTSEKSERGIEESIQSIRINVRWTDVVGLEDVKKVMKQTIIYPTMRPDLFPLGWPRGILLYGPPGCGKTTTAAAVSTEMKGFFYAIDATSVMSKWLGEAEKNVAYIFRKLRGTAAVGTPTILFIDEVDSLLGQRQQEVGGEVRVRNQFLKEMDGLMDKVERIPPLYVIASTNKPWALDWGFIRRFQRRIYISMPNDVVRMELFKHFLRDVQITVDVDCESLSKATEGYTPSDIRDVCQTAMIETVTELFESGRASDPTSKPRSITREDLDDAIRRIRPSVSPEIQRVYDSWAERFRAF